MVKMYCGGIAPRMIHDAPGASRRARRLAVGDRRVQFDFDVQFSNGGSLQGRGFRLDIEGDDISEAALADHLVRDLRLLMVGAVRIRNKSIVVEPTSGRRRTSPAGASST
jgi:arylformamidase